MLRSGRPVPPAGLSEAMASYTEGDHAAAAGRLAEVLETSASSAPLEGEGRALLFLYLGIARLQIGDAGGAESALRRGCTEPSEEGEELVRERTLWYLAQARLLLEDTDGALATLTQLEELQGDYEWNARELGARVRAALE